MKDKLLFPNNTIIKTKLFDLGQDWETPIPGFFILAPIRKIRSIAELTEKESLEFVKLLIKTRKGMLEVLNIRDVYLFENEDTEGSFHFWIFPRLNWMEKFGRKIQSVKPIMDYAQKNMVDEGTIKEVKDYVKKMKDYMKNGN